jgi:BclB C-terminal domain-containing protein
VRRKKEITNDRNHFNKQTNLNLKFMKKKIYAFNKAVFILFASFAMAKSASAQVGVGTTTPVASAQLQIDATNKGILIPRVLKASRPLNPENGLMIYQTDDTAGFYFYKSTAWKRLAASDEVSSAAAPVVNVGSIIPFASGTPAVMTTILGGLQGTVSLVGFGSVATGVSAFGGGTIDLTGSNQGPLLNTAFVTPRNGTLTSMGCSFSNTIALALVGSTVTVTGQLYAAVEGSNMFTAVPGAVVTLAPALTGIVGLGNTASGITTGLNIPMLAGSRYIMVFGATAAGLNLLNTITGYTSASININ